MSWKALIVDTPATRELRLIFGHALPITFPMPEQTPSFELGYQLDLTAVSVEQREMLVSMYCNILHSDRPSVEHILDRYGVSIKPEALIVSLESEFRA
jgi:hypothetical protein